MPGKVHPDYSSFDPDQQTASLREHSLRGGAFTMASQAINFSLRFITTILLARLLMPSDFGLVSMVTALTSFIVVLRNSGLSTATIQRDTVTHEQISTLFWVNVIMASVASILTAALAPVIVGLYDEPRLKNIVWCYALTYLLAGFSIQHFAILNRKMQFGTMTGIGITTNIVSSILAVLLAYIGAGYWALVAMAASTTIVRTCMVWIIHRWRPDHPKRGTGVRVMLRFGLNLTGARVMNQFRTNFDNFLIGTIWGASALGFYTKAYGLLVHPLSQASSPFSQVATPTLSRLQNDPERFIRYYRKGLNILTSVSIPVVAFTVICAEDIILALLGKQWLPSLPLYRALAPAAFLFTLNTASGWLFIPFGRADRHLWSTVATTVITAITFIIGIQWGAIGVAHALSITAIITRPAILLYACHGTPLRLRHLAVALAHPVLCTALSSAVLYACDYYYIGKLDVPLLRLLLLIPAFGLAYAIAYWIVPWRQQTWSELKGFFYMLAGRKKRSPSRIDLHTG